MNQTDEKIDWRTACFDDPFGPRFLRFSDAWIRRETELWADQNRAIELVESKLYKPKEAGDGK